MTNRCLRIFIYTLLVFYFSLFFAKKINLTTADLGRHIINGKVFLEEGVVVSTNFYSYTQPDFPVVTHHWLSGVVFYIIHNLAGFTGLSIFYILLSGITVLTFLLAVEKRSNFLIALLFTVLIVPLMASRKEIRPEGFSYFFLGIYYYLLTLYLKKKISFKVLLPVFLVIQILWVNLHLFFIMGIFIVGIFTFFEFIKQYVQKRKSRHKELLILFLLLVTASLINPYFVKGLLEPLNILREYGYMIIENQSVLFMQSRQPKFEYVYFGLWVIAAIAISIHIMFTKKIMRYSASLVLALAFLALGFRAIRGIPIFGMFFIPLVSGYVFDHFKGSRKSFLWPVIFVVLITFMPGHVFSFSKQGFGVGLMEGVNRSAEFIKENNIKGPIFNNYDIGGYLIYHLFRYEKVFVDNRPEAYSVEFFNNVYVPMQEKEEEWGRLQEEYGLNIIHFYRHDMTTWAQPFLIKRIEDPEWAPVFVDPYTLVLVKNNEENREIINKYEIPKSMFNVK